MAGGGGKIIVSAIATAPRDRFHDITLESSDSGSVDIHLHIHVLDSAFSWWNMQILQFPIRRICTYVYYLPSTSLASGITFCLPPGCCQSPSAPISKHRLHISPPQWLPPLRQCSVSRRCDLVSSPPQSIRTMIKIAAANSGVEVSRIGIWFQCLAFGTGVLHQAFGGFFLGPSKVQSRTEQISDGRRIA